MNVCKNNIYTRAWKPRIEPTPNRSIELRCPVSPIYNIQLYTSGEVFYGPFFNFCRFVEQRPFFLFSTATTTHWEILCNFFPLSIVTLLFGCVILNAFSLSFIQSSWHRFSILKFLVFFSSIFPPHFHQTTTQPSFQNICFHNFSITEVVVTVFKCPHSIPTFTSFILFFFNLFQKHVMQ